MADQLVAIMRMVVGTGLGLMGLALCVLVLRGLYRRNRLLCWCLGLAVIGHLLVGTVLYAVGQHATTTAQRPEFRVVVKSLPPPPPPELPKVLEPPALPKFTLPAGRPSTVTPSTRPPRGRNPQATPGASGAGASAPVPTYTTPPTLPPTPNGTVPVVPHDDFDFTNSSFSITEGDITRPGRGPGGTNGNHGGDRNGDPNGTDGPGLDGGKRGGKVYFIRLKHGDGGWGAHNDGIRRLLGYLNSYFPCEGDSWVMTASEMRDRYLKKGQFPAFVYLYADAQFSLSVSEAAVLRQYLAGGGFLFIDSRPDPFIKDLVARQVAAVQPGASLAAVPNSHPINRFLFRLPYPGIGLNQVDGKNYGVTRNGRLVVFYTMGNFSQLYATFAPDAEPYITAQYQMGANVMLYAIRKGDTHAVTQHAGVKAVMTHQTLERLYPSTRPTAPAAAPEAPAPIKISPSSDADDGPEDILLGDPH